MAEKENGNLRPDGFSLSWSPTILRIGMVGVGGTYYWNPGSEDAPSVTFTGMYGKGTTSGSSGHRWQISMGDLFFEERG